MVGAHFLSTTDGHEAGVGQPIAHRHVERGEPRAVPDKAGSFDSTVILADKKSYQAGRGALVNASLLGALADSM